MASVSGVTTFHFEKLLGSKNYLLWSQKIKAVLGEKELLTWLTTAPTTNADKKADVKCRGNLILSIHDSILPHVAFLETSLEVWEKLESLYRRPSGGDKVLLSRQLFNMRLNSLVVSEKDVFISNMLSLFNDLSLRGTVYQEDQRAHILLSSLGNKFSGFVDMMSEFDETQLSFDLVCSKMSGWMAMKENLQRNSETHGSASFSFAEASVSENCSLVCFRCKKTGHIARNCMLKKKPVAGTSAEGSGGVSKTKGKKAKHWQQTKRAEVDNKCMLVGFNSIDEMKNVKWIIDSGSSKTFVSNPHLLSNASPLSDMHLATLADGQTCRCELMGEINVSQLGIKLGNVVFCSSLKQNILSVKDLVDYGFAVHFEKDNCVISNTRNGNSINICLKDGMYVLDNNVFTSSNKVYNLQGNSLHKKNCIHRWHRALCHANYNAVRKTAQLVGIKLDNCNTYLDCQICKQSKLISAPVLKQSTRKYKRVLEIVHADLAGPFQASWSSNKFLLVLVDGKSRYSWVYFLKSKDQVFEKFKQWYALMRTQHPNFPLLCLRSDRGGEFLNAKMTKFLQDHGIERQMSNPTVSKENGIAERKIGVIQTMYKAMLNDAKMSEKFWCEAVNHANFVLNRKWSSVINQTPFYEFFGKQPSINDLQVFGTFANVHIPRQQRMKRGKTWLRARFLGMAEGTKGFRFLDVNSPGAKVIVSRSASFNMHYNWQDIHANTEVFVPISSSVPDPESGSSSAECSEEEEDEGGETESEGESAEPRVKVERQSVSGSASASTHISPAQQQSQPSSSHSSVSSRHKRQRDSIDEEDQDGNDEVNPSSPVAVRVSKRATKGQPPERLQVSHVTESQWREPLSYNEMLKRPKEERVCWLAAMKREFESLKQLKVMEESDIPSGTNPVGCKWVYKRKMQSDGSYIWKARIVAQGFSQIFQKDFYETYSPTVRTETVRLALGLGAKYGMEIHHWDVETAYLNASLPEQVYMKAIPGFESDTATGVYRLRKALYGLKQSAKCWNICLDQKLKNLGFVRSSVDSCLYFKGTSTKNRMYLLVFVDDILVLAPSSDRINVLFKSLSNELKLKNLGKVQRYLGVDITRSGNTICLNQRDKIQSLLEKTRMNMSKPVTTPMLPEFTKQPRGESFANQSLYRSVLGSLQYIANLSRPDIAFATNLLCRRVNNPSVNDWQAVKRILRYLKGTIGKVLKIVPNSEDLSLFVDASFANEENSKSSSGFLISFAGIPVLWKSKKLANVVLSTMEAEYAALSEALTEMEWVRKLVNEFQMCNTKVPVYCDSQSCIEAAKAEGLKHRTRYIGVRYENVRQMVQDDVIELLYIESECNIADMFTKALTSCKLQNLCNMLFLL